MPQYLSGWFIYSIWQGAIQPTTSEATLTYMGIETTWIHKQLLSLLKPKQSIIKWAYFAGYTLERVYDRKRSGGVSMSEVTSLELTVFYQGIPVLPLGVCVGCGLQNDGPLRVTQFKPKYNSWHGNVFRITSLL